MAEVAAIVVSVLIATLKYNEEGMDVS